MIVEGLTSTSSKSASLQAAEYQQYLSEIQAAIGAKRLDGNGLQGAVRVAFSVSAAGNLTSAQVASSSGHNTLDQQALATLSASQFPTAPLGISAGNRTFYCQFVFV